ncbi:MAG: hypothetical protein ACRELB_27690, partial [Polyangiaceae bacterium]
MRRPLPLALLLATAACGPSSSTGGFEAPGGGGGDAGPASHPSTDGGGEMGAPGALTADGGSTGNLGGDGGTTTGTDCASGAGSYVYVISDADELYTFDPSKFPAASAFTLVGPVPCDSSGVNSMAVDRSATAWVNFNDGSIYRVTTTAPVTCTPTGFVAGQAGFTKDLGMGFSVDAPGSSAETLFVSDNGGPGGDCSKAAPGQGCTGKGLGTLDPATMTLTPLGGYTATAAGYNAELTGTGDGKLYGFFTTSPGAYGPIDKSSGATSAPAPTSLSTVDASNGGYAFSFFGGDFYFYTAPKGNTVVTHLQTATGQTTASPELAFTIVGAGVST